MKPGVALRYRLESLGNDASERYIGGEGDLNDIVIKIANDNDLETDEIARVCESANKSTFLNMFESEPNKCFEFPLASSDDILRSMNKSASDSKDVDDLGIMLTDIRNEGERLKFASDVGHSYRWQEKPEDAHVQTYSQMLQETLEKVSVALGEIETSHHQSILDLETNVNEFVKCAKSEILDGENINSIGNFLAECRPSQVDQIDILMRKVAEVMHIEHHWAGKERLEKTAAAADADLCPDGLSIGTQPVEIINGDNPMIRILDTTVEQVHSVDKNRSRVWEARDVVKYLKGKVYEYIDREQKVGA